VKQLEEFLELLNNKEASENSWRVSIGEIQKKNYDIKAINPNRKEKEDTRTPEELIALIESQSSEISKALSNLRNKGV